MTRVRLSFEWSQLRWREVLVARSAAANDTRGFAFCRRTAEAAVAHIQVIVNRLQLVARELSNAHRQMDRLTVAVGTALENPGTDPGPEPQRDVNILASLPGVGRTVFATLLSEALEPLRHRGHHALRCLCGVAPVTRRSGKSLMVKRRLAAHKRLQDAVYHRAGIAVLRDPLCKAKYAALRARGHGHARALPSIADRLIAVACAMLASQTEFNPGRSRNPSAA